MPGKSVFSEQPFNPPTTDHAYTIIVCAAAAPRAAITLVIALAISDSTRCFNLDLEEKIGVGRSLVAFLSIEPSVVGNLRCLCFFMLATPI